MILPKFTIGYANVSLDFMKRKLYLVLKPCETLSWFLMTQQDSTLYDKKIADLVN